jgi:hypothetical protein
MNRGEASQRAIDQKQPKCSKAGELQTDDQLIHCEVLKIIMISHKYK